MAATTPTGVTATVVSHDQINISWTSVANEGCAIERSTDGVVWSQVYFCPADDANGKSEGAGTQTVKLYDHDHATAYYFRVKHVVSNGTTSPDESSTVAISPTSVTTLTPDNIIYVATTGDDGTGDGSTGSPYATIQYARFQIPTTESGVVLIKAGTYTGETGTHPPENFGGVDFDLAGGLWFLNVSSQRIATEAKPIVIRADVGLSAADVVLDGEYRDGYVGMISLARNSTSYKSDHIHIKNLTIDRGKFFGIYHENSGGASWGSTTGVTEGFVLENVTIKRTASDDSRAGSNLASARLDLMRDLTVRNCDIECERWVTGGTSGYDAYKLDPDNSALWISDVSSSTGGLYAYSCMGGWLIENNYLHDGGLPFFIKDVANNPPLNADAVTFRYNKIENASKAFFTLMGAAGTEEEVFFRVHNNIAVNTQCFARQEGIDQSGRVDLRNNSWYSNGGYSRAADTSQDSSFFHKFAYDVTNQGQTPQELYSVGNIIESDTGVGDYILFADAYSASGSVPSLMSSIEEVDYNVYVGGLCKLYQTSGTGVLTGGKADWTNTAITDNLTVDVGNSWDANSLENQTSSVVSVDVTTGDFTLASGSPAFNLVSATENAGPYQYGGENIGIYTQAEAGALTISSASIDAAGTTLTVNFSEAVDGGVFADFTVAGHPLSEDPAFPLVGDTSVTFTIDTAVERSDSGLVLAYSAAGTAITDDATGAKTLAATPSTSITNNSTVDTVAPTLSSPTGTKTGSTTATGSVATNDYDGNLYWLVDTSATTNQATVLAANNTQAVSVAGAQTPIAATGLPAGTLQYFHFVHKDAAGNDSAVVHSASFTTDSAVGPTLFSAAINSSGSSLLLTFSEAVQESGSESAVTLSTGNTLSAPTGGGTSTLTYALSPYVVAGDVVTVSFAGGANVIEQNGGGTDTAAFTDEAVTSTSTATYPVVLSSPAPAIDATGTVLTFFFDDLLDNLTTPVHTPFFLTGGYVFTSSLLTGTGATFTISPAVQQGDVITLAYVGDASIFTSTTSGLAVQSFSGTAITNNSTVVTVPPVFVAAPEKAKTTISGHTIRQTLDKAGVVYGVRVATGSLDPSPAQVKAGLDALGAAALEVKSVAAVAGQSCSFVFSTGEKNTTYDYYIVAEDSVPNLQENVVQLTATTDNLLFNGSGQGLPAAAPKKKVKMKWDDKKKRR